MDIIKNIFRPIDVMRLALPAVVFVSGAVVMIMELAASRIVAPYLGTSVIVWTSLIGVILAALSLGNWIGGRIADRYPTARTLIYLLLAAGVMVALSSHFRWLLAAIASQMDLQAAAVIGVCVLFGPATVLLGMIAPLAVKLSLIDIARTGRTVGKLYALSNTGSIIGTFLGGFILISFVGSTGIISILSITLGALALFVLAASREIPSVWMWALFAALALALVPSSRAIVFTQGEKLLADVDTRYSRTWVYEQTGAGGQTIRVMSNALGGAQSGMFVENPEQPLFLYIQFFDTFEAFNPGAKSALMIGGSAYSYPRHFIAGDLERRATVIEIDPGVTELARQYFGLTDDPQLTIVHEDARTYLNRSDDRYDVIVVDAFNSSKSIPFQLTTREAVEKVSRNLAANGVVLVNIISALEGEQAGFLTAEYATYRDVFPYVKVYQVQEFNAAKMQNVMLVASQTPLVPREDSPLSRDLERKEWRRDIPPSTPLTDDFAPVERYMSIL